MLPVITYGDMLLTACVLLSVGFVAGVITMFYLLRRKK